jgi:hypothetical protein
MKKGVFIFLSFLLIACGSKPKGNEPKPLYEILSQQTDGGASIRFFEILTEAREIKMLQNDDDLKNKIDANDIANSNFVILNMGEQTTTGYTITIEKVEETADKISITTRDQNPKEEGVKENDVFYYPYTIVKINSKKAIEIH